jgi:hypothetical protein
VTSVRAAARHRQHSNAWNNREPPNNKHRVLRNNRDQWNNLVARNSRE